MRDDDVRSGGADAEEPGTLIAAALIGAAIGAGLGLLASRALEDEGVSVMLRSARRRAGREIRRRSRAAARLGSAAGEAIGDTRDSIADLAARARDSFEDVLQREVRQLRKAARRQRRRLGL
jgi:monoamine oxidase